uniref:VWFA domain-containing protein n=1 Tax=Catharus ustulatus TaxID=91951 RepID=A0A8C3TI24_CATUS
TMEIKVIQGAKVPKGRLETQDLQGCGIKCRVTPLELVFVIDSSESVGVGDFNIIKTFMKTFIDKISADHVTTRIGIINFSHKAVVVSSLQNYTGKEDLKSTIDKMDYLGEGTYTASAIQGAINLFQEARPAVRKVAVVITDGQADSRDEEPLDSVVRKAHAAHIEIFVIGMSKTTDPHYNDFLDELKLIATDPDEEHVYPIHDFKTLSEIINHNEHQFSMSFFGILLFCERLHQPSFTVLLCLAIV